LKLVIFLERSVAHSDSRRLRSGLSGCLGHGDGLEDPRPSPTHHLLRSLTIAPLSSLNVHHLTAPTPHLRSVAHSDSRRLRSGLSGCLGHGDGLEVWRYQ
jgi:hypothetical protein